MSADCISTPAREIIRSNYYREMSTPRSQSLLLLGHGSSKHPDSSSSVRSHAEALRQRGHFASVHCAFLKEEPRIEHALEEIEKMGSDHITIVPDFLAKGYFTQQAIPELLEINQRQGQIRYSDPVGVHPMMRELILDAAEDVIGEWSLRGVSLLLVGHGSRKNAQSKQSLLDHIAALKKSTGFAQIADLWLEESPLVSDWLTVATQKKIIVVPFLLSDGQHGGWDIPEALGLSKNDSIDGVTHRVGDVEFRLTHALGTSLRFPEVIEMM